MYALKILPYGERLGGVIVGHEESNYIIAVDALSTMLSAVLLKITPFEAHTETSSCTFS
jgi:hypothetical protein